MQNANYTSRYKDGKANQNTIVYNMLQEKPLVLGRNMGKLKLNTRARSKHKYKAPPEMYIQNIISGFKFKPQAPLGMCN